MSDKKINQALLDMLRCPACEDRPKVNLVSEDKLVCIKCGRTYPVKDGIPHMLVEEAGQGGDK